MRPKAEWAIEPEPIRARGIIVKELSTVDGTITDKQEFIEQRNSESIAHEAEGRMGY